VGEFASATADEAQSAIAAARAAFPAWSRSGVLERARLLRDTSQEILRRKDEIGALLSREEGKTLPEGVTFQANVGSSLALLGGGVASFWGGKDDGESVTGKLKPGQTARIVLIPDAHPSYDVLLGYHPELAGRATVGLPVLLPARVRQDLAITITAIKEIDLSTLPWFVSVASLGGPS
jgi:aldehyde dehydrogenase (NAD+)